MKPGARARPRLHVILVVVVLSVGGGTPVGKPPVKDWWIGGCQRTNTRELPLFHGVPLKRPLRTERPPSGQDRPRLQSVIEP